MASAMMAITTSSSMRGEAGADAAASIASCRRRHCYFAARLAVRANNTSIVAFHAGFRY